jgi:O-acetyl-ADP-ribose deacetylase (regulator of RNase III)
VSVSFGASQDETMTQWRIIQGDILATVADGLLCSANPELNLSGGVGGAFAMRYGREMQAFLHSHLASDGSRFAAPGTCVLAPPCGSPYRAVAHAVAIDAFYDTTPDVIRCAYNAALRALADAGCRSIAAACLACGYGRLSPADFANAIAPLLSSPFEGIDTVSLVTSSADVFAAVSERLGANVADRNRYHEGTELDGDGIGS